MIFKFLSEEPVSKIFPSCEYSIVLTRALCGLITAKEPLLLNKYINIYGVFVQILTVSSFEAEAMCDPPGEIAISLTAPLWPVNLNDFLFAFKLKAYTVPSRQPVTACLL